MSAINGWKKVLLFYVIALAISHLTTWILQNPVGEEEHVKNQEISLNIVNSGHSLADDEVTIGYDNIYEGEKENPPVLLLLPGGPEGPEVFDEIIPKLATNYRLVIPHLPGYKGKNEDLPNYSFQSSALYAQQFLEKLDISEAHVFGFGLGGASAIQLAQNDPQRVASLGLIAAIGVQELELLGSYRLNHAVHGMQLTGVWLFYNAIPHFGLFERFEIDVSYAKRHYESDQRPIRTYLEQFDKPMLILHGKDDPLVPLAAAQEHHRIVPQSVLKLYGGDHDILQTHSDSVSTDIHEFLGQVQNGEAQTKASASEDRIAESKKSFSNVDFAKFEGLSLLIIMLIIILGTFFSEDLACIGAGLLAARGLIGFWPASVACFAGIFIGDVGLYLAGRFLGRPALKKAPFKWIIDEEDLKNSSQWFKARGPAIIIATRFLPGSRLPTYFSAGVMQAGFWMFLFYFVLSGIIWVPLMVGITQLLGNELLRYFTLFEGYAMWFLAGGIGIIFFTAKIIIPAFSYKGRRLLASRYYKITSWQHWWPVFKYTPVSCYILYLGVKYRCLTLFTATNPAVGEADLAPKTKNGLLNLFKHSDKIVPHQKITYASDLREMLDSADQFMSNYKLTYPIVLKPDAAASNKSSEIIESRYEMQDYLEKASEDLIIQQYVEGQQLEIYYYRFPGQERGSIFSMTKKELPSIGGDGQKTLEELILSNKTTVAFAQEFLEAHNDHLYDIPNAGEKRILADLGTYEKGAIFSDITDEVTANLTNSINEVSSSTGEFYFGSFDIIVQDYQSLSSGEGYKIVEVNGVKLRNNVIYDNEYSFFEGQRKLMKQWKLIFEIGLENQKRGGKATPVTTFLKKVFRQYTKQ